MRQNNINHIEVANAPFHETPINALSFRKAYDEWAKRRGIDTSRNPYKVKAQKQAAEKARKANGRFA